MSVCLCDTTTSRDIHINDSLVSQGLALFTPDSMEDKEEFDSYPLEGKPVGVRQITTGIASYTPPPPPPRLGGVWVGEAPTKKKGKTEKTFPWLLGSLAFGLLLR